MYINFIWHRKYLLCTWIINYIEGNINHLFTIWNMFIGKWVDYVCFSMKKKLKNLKCFLLFTKLFVFTLLVCGDLSDVRTRGNEIRFWNFHKYSRWRTFFLNPHELFLITPLGYKNLISIQKPTLKTGVFCILNIVSKENPCSS